MTDHQGQLEALLSVPDAADVLGVSPVTTRRLIRSGDLPSVRVGDRVLIEPSAVRAFIDAHREGGGP